MVLADTFNPETYSQEVTSSFYQRMLDNAEAWGLQETQVQAMSNLLFEMVKISGALYLEEPGILAADGKTNFPIDEKMARQGISLFAEGVFHAQLKAHASGLPDEVTTQLVQGLAQDLYQQSKQVVASTYGQDETPDLQFSWEQQASWMQQSADNGFMFYLNEYEKQNGPVNATPIATSIVPNVPTQPQDVPQSEEASESILPEHPSEEESDVQQVEPAPLPEGPAQPQPASGLSAEEEKKPVPQKLGQNLPSRPEKYAALALFLAFLPASRASLRNSLLKGLSSEEVQLVHTFQQMESLAGTGLDIGQVQHYLSQLNDLLHQQLQGHIQQAEITETLHQQLKTMTAGERVYALRGERPKLRQFVTRLMEVGAPGLNAGKPEWERLLNPENDANRWTRPPDHLPSPVQTVLLEYLAGRV